MTFPQNYVKYYRYQFHNVINTGPPGNMLVDYVLYHCAVLRNCGVFWMRWCEWFTGRLICKPMQWCAVLIWILSEYMHCFGLDLITIVRWILMIEYCKNKIIHLIPSIRIDKNMIWFIVWICLMRFLINWLFFFCFFSFLLFKTFEWWIFLFFLWR